MTSSGTWWFQKDDRLLDIGGRCPGRKELSVDSGSCAGLWFWILNLEDYLS